MVLKGGFERAGVFLCTAAVRSQKALGHKGVPAPHYPAEGNAQCSAGLCPRKQDLVIPLFHVPRIPFRQIVLNLLYSKALAWPLASRQLLISLLGFCNVQSLDSINVKKIPNLLKLLADIYQFQKNNYLLNVSRTAIKYCYMTFGNEHSMTDKRILTHVRSSCKD